MGTKEDFIKQELAKSGFDLEDNVASVFRKLKNFEVEPSYNFTDWQTGDVRELDLRVTYEVTTAPIKIEYVLLIECKKLPGNAWAFIKSTGDSIISKNSISVWDNIGTLGRQNHLVDIVKPITKVNSIIADTFSSRYKEIITDKDKSNKREENILTCTTKLAKAIYFEQRMQETNNSLVASLKKDIDYVKIYYPIVVFEGEMYEATMLPNLTVRPISSVHLDSFSIQNKQELSTTIDFVKLQHLKSFLQKGMLIEASQIRENEKNNRNAYLKQIRKIKQKTKLNKSLEQLIGFVPRII